MFIGLLWSHWRDVLVQRRVSLWKIRVQDTSEKCLVESLFHKANSFSWIRRIFVLLLMFRLLLNFAKREDENEREHRLESCPKRDFIWSNKHFIAMFSVLESSSVFSSCKSTIDLRFYSKRSIRFLSFLKNEKIMNEQKNSLSRLRWNGMKRITSVSQAMTFITCWAIVKSFWVKRKRLPKDFRMEIYRDETFSVWT